MLTTNFTDQPQVRHVYAFRNIRNAKLLFLCSMPNMSCAADTPCRMDAKDAEPDCVSF